MEFENPELLEQAILSDILDAINEVGGDVVEVLKGYVEQIVYDPYSPRAYIRRHETTQNGFYESWESSLRDDGNTISAIIFSNPEYMGATMAKRYMASTNSAGEIISEDFEEVEISNRNDILDEAIAEGTHWDFFPGKEQEAWWQHPRDYMSPSLAYVDANLYAKMKSALEKNGVELK